MISSSRSVLYRFLILYGSLYAGFGVQSPYLPILLDNRHLPPETIALALAAGTAMRLMAAQAVARLADRLDAPRVFLALCTTAAALIGLGYLPAQGAWLLIAVGVLHSAALAPLPPLSDTLALGAAAPAGSGGAVIHYGWLRGCGSAAFAVGCLLPRHPWHLAFHNYCRPVATPQPRRARLAGSECCCGCRSIARWFCSQC
jgi:PPP family 3-phenylpropionic acid transporter